MSIMPDESLLPPLPLPPTTVTPTSTPPPPPVRVVVEATPLPPSPPVPAAVLPSPPASTLPPLPTTASSTSLALEKTLLATRSDNGGGSNHDDLPTPPPYTSPISGPGATTPARRDSQTPPYYPGIPRLDYKLYSPPLFTLSPDCTVLSSKSEHLAGDAKALVSFIRTQASIPPKPLIHIKGTSGRKVDFDIRLNLMGLLVPDDETKIMQYIRCVGQGEVAYRGGVKPDVIPEVGDRELEEWCHRFVEDPAQAKSFAMERVVANMDTLWIEGQLRALLASTQYKGTLHISFPVTHAKVVVGNPPRANKFMSSMKKLFSGKNKYEVVRSVWPFASGRNGHEGRRCAVQSEEVWWREWRDPIKYAISQKRQNGAYVTNEDKLEALMEGKGQGVSAIDWGEGSDVPTPNGAELEG